MSTRPHVQKLVERARLLPALATAMVFPCDSESLQLALSGSFAGFLAPVLVGPDARIRDVANRAGVDISRLAIVNTPDDPKAAAMQAVRLAVEGRVAALVKGAMSDGELLGPVAALDSGLRTDSRLSHAAFLDVPGMNRWLLVADALLNVTPNLAAKKDIVQNTARLAMALGQAAPNIALIAGMDVVATALPSTSEAAALKSMALEGLFPGAVIEGPMLPDMALRVDDARSNPARNEMAGRADVLIAPTLEAAVMVLRTLTGITQGLACGIVLGAKVPIVVPARSDSMEMRMASCVIASLAAAHAAASARQASAAAIVPAAASRVAA
ncbi:MAG: bifunctional enoyl-CoA hydratase/phosphate acetyltransferase [Betaproteobacteria bacterium]